MLTLLSAIFPKGKIFEFLWHLKKEGYQKATINSYVHMLKLLVKRGANISNEQSVKLLIADEVEKKHWNEARKSNIIKAYTAFLRMQGLDWMHACMSLNQTSDMYTSLFFSNEKVIFSLRIRKNNVD